MTEFGESVFEIIDLKSVQFVVGEIQVLKVGKESELLWKQLKTIVGEVNMMQLCQTVSEDGIRQRSVEHGESCFEVLCGSE